MWAWKVPGGHLGAGRSTPRGRRTEGRGVERAFGALTLKLNQLNPAARTATECVEHTHK